MRSRVQDRRKTVKGTRYYYAYPNLVPTTENTVVGTIRTTLDEVGLREQDNAFESTTYSRRATWMDGEGRSSSGTVFARFENVGTYAAARAIPSPKAFALPNFTALVPLWLGQMMPGQPAVNLPAIIGESPDIPRLFTQLPSMIKRWGAMRTGRNRSAANVAAGILKRIVGDASSTHLGVQFGVNPLIADVAAMLGIMEDILRTLEALRRLYDGKEIKKSRRLTPQRLVKEYGPVTTWSAGAIVTENRAEVFTSKSWVTSRWAPLIPAALRSPPPLPEEMMSQAIRYTLGLTPGGLVDAWWELLPWSWLADWLAQVQAYLRLAVGNQMILKCVSLCYCRTSVVDVYWNVYSKPTWLTVTGPAFQQGVVKERIPLLGTISPDSFKPELPALNGRQWGILAALAGQALT